MQRTRRQVLLEPFGSGRLLCCAGPDPKLVKAAASDFYKANNGTTTVSASGAHIWSSEQFTFFHSHLEGRVM